MAKKIKITDKDFQIKIAAIKIYKCSNCKKNDIKINYKYCPHCGGFLVFKLSEKD